MSTRSLTEFQDTVKSVREETMNKTIFWSVLFGLPTGLFLLSRLHWPLWMKAAVAVAVLAAVFIGIIKRMEYLDRRDEREFMKNPKWDETLT